MEQKSKAAMIAEDSAPQVSPEVAAKLVNKAKELWRLNAEIVEDERRLKEKEERYRVLAEETLPDLMESAGVASLPLGEGYLLEVEPVFRANIPAESTIEHADEEERVILEARRAGAFHWLRKNKAGDLIKHTLKIELGRGMGTVLKSFVNLAKKQKVPMKAIEAVHASTLAKFLKEKLEKGANVPVEIFALYRGREAKIKAPKAVKIK